MSYNLIVTGKCRGEVWNFTDAGVNFAVNGKIFQAGLSCGWMIKMKQTISKIMCMMKLR
ncbi:MAG: hypothetical protein K2N44_05810 [Lachnospiraceae bacterium]|nr:hypothetical protein [Lachnospiraceae bacterium]